MKSQETTFKGFVWDRAPFALQQRHELFLVAEKQSCHQLPYATQPSLYQQWQHLSTQVLLVVNRVSLLGDTCKEQRKSGYPFKGAKGIQIANIGNMGVEGRPFVESKHERKGITSCTFEIISVLMMNRRVIFQ